MQYTRLGKSDLLVSRICMGCMEFGDPSTGQHRWTLDETASRDIIRHALEQGINFTIPPSPIRTAPANGTLAGRCGRWQNARRWCWPPSFCHEPLPRLPRDQRKTGDSPLA